MANCSWFVCSTALLICYIVVVSSESVKNGTSEIVRVESANETVHSNETETRDGRKFNAHPLKVEETQSLSPRPKSVGTGTWKAIKIWNEPIGVSSSQTTKRASSPERVVASSGKRHDSHHGITLFVVFNLIFCYATC